MEEYKRTMGRVRASDDLKKRIKQSAELGVEPRPLAERRAVRPGVARALTIAATIVVTLIVLTAFVLLVRFVGPQGEPPEPTGEVGIAPVEPNGFELISCTTQCLDVMVLFNSGSADGTVSYTWVNNTEHEVRYSEYVRALKLVDGRWMEYWSEDGFIVTIPDIMRLIEPNSKVEESMSLSSYGSPITAGQYKLERDFHVNGETHTLTIEFRLTAKKEEDNFESDEFKLISIDSGSDSVNVNIESYNSENRNFSINLETAEGYLIYDCEADRRSIDQMVDGTWKCLTTDEPVPTTLSYDLVGGVYTFNLRPHGQRIGFGHFRVIKQFLLSPVDAAKDKYGRPEGEAFTVTIEFELTEKEKETQFPLGTGGAPFVSFVDCGNNVSDKFPGLIAEVVDFDDDKNLLWVDFTNKGSEDHTVDASFAIMDLNNGIPSDMSSDSNGGFSVMSGTVTHTSFALSNYWKNGEIVTGRYALLLNIDGQSVELNFDIYVDTP